MAFHAKAGWWFTRMDDGSVRVHRQSVDGIRILDSIVFSVTEWASIVSSVSNTGETRQSWADAVDRQMPL